MFNRQDLQLIDILGEQDYIDTLIQDISKINECRPDSKRWEYAYDCTSKRPNAAYFNVFFDNKDRDVLTKDCKELNKLTMMPLEEGCMNIYEKLNKINDSESLSEKYNVKNTKELKKLRESKGKDAETGYIFQLGWYFDADGNEVESGSGADWNAMYTIDTTDGYKSVGQAFVNQVLKPILNGKKHVSEGVTYPFVIREVGETYNQAVINDSNDLLSVIDEIEKGEWEPEGGHVSDFDYDTYYNGIVEDILKRYFIGIQRSANFDRIVSMIRKSCSGIRH